MKKFKDLQQLMSLIPEIEIDSKEKIVTLDNPEPFLKLLSRAENKRIKVDGFKILQPWGIAALAALGRTNNQGKIYVMNDKSSPSARFADALGLSEIIYSDSINYKLESDRTVKLRELTSYGEIEPISEEISCLIIDDAKQSNESEYFDAEEVRKTIRYVLIEALRNVIQHSEDRSGAIVLAQRMDKNSEIDIPYIQIAVVDCGIGIYNSLIKTHKDISTPEVALERSLWPYYSGKFHSFQQSSYNAGLGLFFISEITKLTSGKMLIASRDASLLLLGDPDCQGNNKISTFSCGFPGTLLAFEMPKRGVVDYDELIKKIAMTAKERANFNEQIRWLRFDLPKEDAIEFCINIASENTVEAENFSREQLIPRILQKQPIVLNFINMKICTQSYLHSLLFEAIRKSYEMKVPIFVKGASPSVTDGIHLVEAYTLSPYINMKKNEI